MKPTRISIPHVEFGTERACDKQPILQFKDDMTDWSRRRLYEDFISAVPFDKWLEQLTSGKTRYGRY